MLLELGFGCYRPADFVLFPYALQCIGTAFQQVNKPDKPCGFAGYLLRWIPVMAIAVCVRNRKMVDKD